MNARKYPYIIELEFFLVHFKDNIRFTKTKGLEREGFRGMSSSLGKSLYKHAQRRVNKRIEKHEKYSSKIQ